MSASRVLALATLFLATTFVQAECEFTFPPPRILRLFSPRVPNDSGALDGTYTSSVPPPALSLTELRTQTTRQVRIGKAQWTANVIRL